MNDKNDKLLHDITLTAFKEGTLSLATHCGHLDKHKRNHYFKESRQNMNYENKTLKNVFFDRYCYCYLDE